MTTLTDWENFYVIVVGRRLRAQKTYEPVFEDWLFHILLPFAAYAALVVSACAAQLIRVRLFSLSAGVVTAALHWYSQCLGHH